MEGQDGSTFAWQIHTRDGQAAEMWLDGRPIDLSQGRLFMVRTEGDEIAVEQLERDFSQLAPTNTAIEALAVSDPDVAAFVEEARPER